MDLVGRVKREAGPSSVHRSDQAGAAPATVGESRDPKMPLCLVHGKAVSSVETLLTSPETGLKVSDRCGGHSGWLVCLRP
jgi:hypothetical protein